MAFITSGEIAKDLGYCFWFEPAAALLTDYLSVFVGSTESETYGNYAEGVGLLFGVTDPAVLLWHTQI